MRKSGSLAASGVRTGIPSVSAASWTGLGVSFLLRPAGAGGCVTTETIWKAEDDEYGEDEEDAEFIEAV